MQNIYKQTFTITKIVHKKKRGGKKILDRE
jgi:hypothetical protein